ncbi:unnamed protein product [Schistosoma margrebowiei]|uniref:Uncharacterized protein n=1 Tax=Schistosoma margrebowiei TaxID=48269 RepID=A0A183MM73_9TREM|nr:unnamed protein product [Schistosoma margrebowiei]
MELSRPKRRGGPKNTLHREMETDMIRMNNNWEELERKAEDRMGWRILVGDLCSIGGNRRNPFVCGVKRHGNSYSLCSNLNVKGSIRATSLRNN